MKANDLYMRIGKRMVLISKHNNGLNEIDIYYFTCVYLETVVVCDFQVCTSEDSCRFSRISELFVYEKFSRVPVESVEAGDICAVCGINDVQVHFFFFTVYQTIILHF